MKVTGIDHVQVAIPEGSEDRARAFYKNVLGLKEVEKPEKLKGRGGLWFEDGSLKLHLGIDKDFIPAKKAHPGIAVVGLEDYKSKLIETGHPMVEGEKLPGQDRIFTEDPFGNRIELVEHEIDQ